MDMKLKNYMAVVKKNMPLRLFVFFILITGPQRAHEKCSKQRLTYSNRANIYSDIIT